MSRLNLKQVHARRSMWNVSVLEALDVGGTAVVFVTVILGQGREKTSLYHLAIVVVHS